MRSTEYKVFIFRACGNKNTANTRNIAIETSSRQMLATVIFYLYVSIHTHTHTHTTYIYIYIYTGNKYLLYIRIKGAPSETLLLTHFYPCR